MTDQNVLPDLLLRVSDLRRDLAALHRSDIEKERLHATRGTIPALLDRLDWFQRVAQPACNEIVKEDKHHG